ncbi:MAG: LytTR family transcriptional regulator DNA-binding domain-containing protein [Pseudomonadota bacterium]
MESKASALGGGKCRIHRSAIARVSKDFQGRFLLKLSEHQETLIVSRAYAYRFKQM